MQFYQQTYAAPATWQLNVPGNYFTLFGCTNPVNIRFYKQSKLLNAGQINSVLAGIEAGPFKDVKADGIAFDRVEIDFSAADTVTCGIGDGSVRYNRSQGSVQITSGTLTGITNPVTLATWLGLNKTNAPGFVGAMDRTAGGAGLFGEVQLFNPAASGKTVYVDRIKIRAQTATEFQLKTTVAGITTDVGAGFNRVLGGAASVAHIRTAADVAPIGTIIDLIGCNNLGFTDLRWDEPYQIPQGSGLLIVDANANDGYTASFEWREI
jgi:hypothetical protein